MTSRLIAVVLVFAWAAAGVRPAAAQAAFPAPVEADFVARDVAFTSGERLPEVRLHYRTVGTPRKDADGVIRNGVLILHGTGGSGAGFLSAGYGGLLFGKGQLLDAERYYIILPDNVGHGRSSKPSDGLADEVPGLPLHRHGPAAAPPGHRRARTHPPAPGDGHVDGRDAQLDVGLPVSALRRRPGAAGQQPGRDRRPQPGLAQGLVDAIVTDPTWKDGNYTEPPRGMASALGFLLIATSTPMQWQKQFATAAAADAWLADQIATRLKTTDANDTIYHFRASEDYDPSPHLEQITAPLLAINSADDFVNPPELPMMQALIARVKHGRFILLPATEATRGHGTHSLPAVWGEHLAAFLASLSN